MHAFVHRSSFALACCLVIAAIGACKPGDKVGGADRVQPKSCVLDSDCSSDGSKICTGGICIPNVAPTCSEGESCPDGMKCDDLSGVCIPVSTPDGGTNNNDGGTTSCSARCDCPIGNACMNGRCAAVALMAECATDAQCGRGQTCNFSHKCEAGCTDSCDCEAPKTCSMTRFQCENCSANNPCPSGQVCAAPSGGAPACMPTVSCTSSADCNSAAPGTICQSGSCVNCTLDNQCQSAPYGGGYICSAGTCQTGCNTAQCNTTCTQQGLSCNTVSCQCTAPECTNANCNGAACTGTDVCDSTCNCVPIGTSTDCTTQGCSNGQTCVQSDPSGPFGMACGDGTSACATDCSFNSCPSGWECVDLSQSLCTSFGSLTTGSFCAKQCSGPSDCPGGQDCCATSEGFNVCSALGACITM